MRSATIFALIFVLVLGYPAEAHAVGAFAVKTRDQITIRGVDSIGDTDAFFMKGRYTCIAYSPTAAWDSANIDLEKRITGTSDWKDVDVAALVNMVADIANTPIYAGAGEYRLEIESSGGSSDVTFHCGRSVD